MPTFPFLFLNSAALQHLPASLFQTIQQFTVLVLCLSFATECKPDFESQPEQLPAASNITLVLVKWFPPAVKVQWQLNQKTVANVKEMQILYNPVRSSVRSMIKVQPDVRQVTLNKLQPNQEYELELVSTSKNSMLTNSSSIVNFISPSNESSPISKFAYYTPYSQEELRRKLRITMDEIVILIIVLIVWLTVICIFCSKWSKLRHLEPYHPDYRPSLGSTAQHSPAYSVDSDNLANVGALTTTPVASGGLGDMTDEDDDGGLLIGNAAPLANLQPPIIPCSGIHSTVPLCAHAANLPVCGGVLIHDPSNLPMYGAAGDDVNDINIPIPTTSLANSGQQAGKSDKKVQFQSVHPPSSGASQSYHIAQFADRASSPAAFVLPVSMATPHLSDLYCHGAAKIACHANFSSVDSTTSYNSTSCASCNYAMQQGGIVQAGHTCVSQTGSLDQAPMYGTGTTGTTDPSTDSNASSSLKQQQSVESIWIELPSRFHIRSNSTPSEETNLTTVIYNTPTGSAMNHRHSPVTEEPSSSGEDDQHQQADAARCRQSIVPRSKSEQWFVRSTTKVERKSRSLELQAVLRENDGHTTDALANRKEPEAIADAGRRKFGRTERFRIRPYYHSVDHIDHNLPHSTPYIKRYHSSSGLSNLPPFASSGEQLARRSKGELPKCRHKRRAPKAELLRKEHYNSDNLIMKTRHRLRELSEREFRSSLPNQRAPPFQPVHRQPLHRSLTETSETSSCFTRSVASGSSSSERLPRADVNSRVCSKVRSKRGKRETDLVQLIARKSLSTTDSTDNETDRTQQAGGKRTGRHYANTRGRDKQQEDSTTITMQSSESSFEFERPVDEAQLNRLGSIWERSADSTEPDRPYGVLSEAVDQQPAMNETVNRLADWPISCPASGSIRQAASKFRVYQSATMYNISSTFDEPTELLISDLSELSEQRPIRRYQSAEQMLKRLIRSLHEHYRRQFKS